MTTTSITALPKFDHVGSFLRPQRIKEARVQFANGELTKDQLWDIENEEIEKLVQQQVDNGLKIVTDGEYRRSYFHLDFMWGCQGIEHITVDHGYRFNNNVESKPDSAAVTGKISLGNHPVLQEYEVLHEIAEQHGVQARLAVPSPSMFFFRTRTDAEKEIYPTEESFFADLADVYKELIAELYARGCRNLQFDDTTWSLFLQDNTGTEVEGQVLAGGFVESLGLDPKETIQLFVDTVNDVLASKPADLTVGMHVCRGNYKSEYAGSGSYQAVQDIIFSQLNYDALLLEFDDERSGDVDVLKSATKDDQLLVLGFITSKRGELEDPEFIKSRIEKAAQYVPKERLALSPQCGFASTEEGNKLTEDEQWAKVRHVVDIANDVWK